MKRYRVRSKGGEYYVKDTETDGSVLRILGRGEDCKREAEEVCRIMNAWTIAGQDSRRTFLDWQKEQLGD